MRADAGAELVELVRLLDAVAQEEEARGLRLDGELAEAVAVERGEQQVADADVELDAPRSVSRSGAGGVVSSVSRAPTRRWRKSASVSRWTSPSMSSSPGGAITKSTRVLSGLRRSTVSAVMRAPVIIEKAKNASPTISQSAWKLPIPSPMRSNQPSVRTASRENTRSFGMVRPDHRGASRTTGASPKGAETRTGGRRSQEKLLGRASRRSAARAARRPSLPIARVHPPPTYGDPHPRPKPCSSRPPSDPHGRPPRPSRLRRRAGRARS